MRTSTLLVVPFLMMIASVAHAQRKDSTFFFRADLSVTNNGFSLVPAFTLGKPAAFLDMRMGNKRLSFEPQFRYSLKGRPWSFIFIYRYKAIMKPRFQLAIGGHLPGINYITQPVTVGTITEPLSVARRFLAAEVIPTYIISKKVSVGLYYLRGHAFQQHGVQNSNFLSLQGNFMRLKLAGKAFVSFNPQLFYLKVDADDGVYINSTTTVGFEGFPLTISNILNKAIDSTIPAKDFDWNVSLVYTLQRNFVAK